MSPQVVSSTATPSKRRTFRSILRENALVKAVRQKTVRVREEFNEYFLITPRRPRPCSPSSAPPTPVSSQSMPEPLDFDESLSAENWARRSKKISKRLSEVVKRSADRSNASNEDRIYLDTLRKSIEAKIMETQEYALFMHLTFI